MPSPADVRVVPDTAAGGAPQPSVPSMGRASATLAGAMLIASAANYLLNLCLARWMSPDEFGDANLMVTLMLACSAVAVALQLLTARRVSTTGDDAGQAGDSHAGVRRQSLRRAWIIGGVIGSVVVIGAPTLRTATSSASAVPFVILAVGIPMYLAQAVERGVLQGQLRFGRLALTFLVEAATRLAATLGAVALGFGVVGATTGLSISFLASWSAARPTRPPTTAVANSRTTSRTTLRSDTNGLARRAAGATSILLLAQIIINNGDVVLAKIMFDADSAGVYAVVALIGRGVFFLTWSIVMAAFPMAARDGSRAVVRRAVLMVATLSATATAAVAIVMPRLTGVIFGDEYLSASGEFARYAVATSLFAVANVIATLELASGRGTAAAVVLFGAVAQTAVLLTAGSPTAMVDVQIGAMGAVSAATIIVFLRSAPRAGARA